MKKKKLLKISMIFLFCAFMLAACGGGGGGGGGGGDIVCTDSDGDGYYVEGGGCGAIDCNDADPQEYPDVTWYADADGDTYGDPESSSTCERASIDDVTDNTDCDDADPTIKPGVVEVCDDVDNNCNGSIDEDLSQACGSNAGECSQGTQICTDGVWGVCEGGVDPTSETCDGLDNNCDGDVDEGCLCINGDVQACGSDVGECSQGTQTCTGGAWGACTGAVGPTAEVCNGLDDDCDGTVDDGLNNNNPSCSGSSNSLGSINGDTGAETLTYTFYGEKWPRFYLAEDNNGIVYLSATIKLWSPAGTDYDLYVYCNTCGGGLADSSATGHMNGHWDEVQVRTDDTWLVDDGFEVIVEVRHYSSNICANWDLEIYGNTSVSTETCS